MKRDQAILLVLSGLAAGCSSPRGLGLNESRQSKTRKKIENTVQDPERRRALLAVVDSLDKEMNRIMDRALALREELDAKIRDYAISRAELEPFYADLGGLTIEFGDAAKKHSLQLRALCSQDEWKQIATHKTEAIHFTF